jgi:hypothetical protein
MGGAKPLDSRSASERVDTVGVKKTRQNKKREPDFDSIRPEKV